MVSRKSRRQKRQQLMVSHNRCWLWGRHLVRETLTAARWPIVELRLSQTLDDDERSAVESLTGDRDIPVTRESAERLTQLCGAADHQGYLAKMRPYPYLTVDELLTEVPRARILCLLDGIQDPHNFGAILRSVEVLGIDGVIVGSSGQSQVTSAVARSSAGAINYVLLAQTDNLVASAARLKGDHGYQLVAASQRGELTPTELEWKSPSVLVIGNEAAGVRRDLQSLCNAVIRIPQSGRTESLNAAVAAGILFYEIRRQSRKPSTSDRADPC